MWPYIGGDPKGITENDFESLTFISSYEYHMVVCFICSLSPGPSGLQSNKLTIEKQFKSQAEIKKA